MICVSLAEPDFGRCLGMVQRYPFTEIRLDAAAFNLDEVRQLFSTGNKTIATYRPGNEDDRIRQKALAEAVRAGATYLDIEYEAEDSYRKELIREAAGRGCSLIISWHDYEKTPDQEELELIMDRCYAMGADIAKIACMVNERQDMVRLLSLYNLPGKKVVLGMGEKGSFSRIAAALLGAEFTFAPPDDGHETAPGQLSLSELQQYLNRFLIP
ncbi:MAG: type I 3-dehydroquinate dehydratase [Bacteroidales bacterium]